MKRITMLRSGPGSPNGLDVVQYERGTGYDVPESLALAFERIGYARIEGAADLPAASPAPVIAEPAAEPMPQDAPAVASADTPAAKAPRKPRHLSGTKDRSLSVKAD